MYSFSIVLCKRQCSDIIQLREKHVMAKGKQWAGTANFSWFSRNQHYCMLGHVLLIISKHVLQRGPVPTQSAVPSKSTKHQCCSTRTAAASWTPFLYSYFKKTVLLLTKSDNSWGKRDRLWNWNPNWIFWLGSICTLRIYSEMVQRNFKERQ